MNLGKAIKLCRVQRGLSQVELASRCDLSLSYLSLLEHSKRNPVFSVLNKIATALDIPLFMLIYLASNEEERSKLSSEIQEKMSFLALRLLDDK